MKSNFEACLKHTLTHEGGWSDHPRDPGGATMKGVTLAVYRAHKGYAASKSELRGISDADLKAIYRKGYWDAMGCDDLPAGLDLSVFDLAVNSGPGRARKYLEKTAAITDIPSRIRAFNSLRRAFLQSLKNFTVFGKGWMRRVNEVEALSLKMSNAPPVPKNDKPLAKSRTTQGAGAGAGGGAVIIAQKTQEAVEQLEKADGAISSGTMIGLVIGVVVLAGCLYALYARWDDAGRPLPWARA